MVNALLISSLVSVLMYAVRIFHFHTTRFWFLNWNLFLAWLPLGFAALLYNYVQKKPWLSWPGLLLTVLWLGFLPNSFYIISDLVHLQVSQNATVLYDVAMISSFAFNGLALGFMSIYFVHLCLMKRVKPAAAHTIVAGVLLLCSFAIYLGRYLRWSTWDVLINPAGLLFDVSDRVLNPAAHEQTFETTIIFFVVLSSMYLLIWQITGAVRESAKN